MSEGAHVVDSCGGGSRNLVVSRRKANASVGAFERIDAV